MRPDLSVSEPRRQYAPSSAAARPERLPRPAHDNIESNFWIDEAIWGHRLHDEQLPWLVFLEFLGVLHAEAEAGRPFVESQLNRLAYRAHRRMHLRNIVFNNPFVNIVRGQGVADDARWDRWLADVQKHASGVTSERRDFSYLRQRFDSFEHFAQLLGLIRGTAIEGDSNKRWTSKFVFPYGPSCLYEDVRLDDDGTASNDRRFFGRTGEVLYLMLCRSGRGETLYNRLAPLVLNREARWDRLVARLQPPAEEPRPAREGERGPFLPYAALDEYARLADDLLALLDRQMPGYDVLPHLIDLIGLHLVLYQLRRSAEWAPNARPVSLVLEVIAPKRTTVRDLAVESYQSNGLLSEKALDGFIDCEIERSPEWAAALASDDAFAAATRVVWEKVAWNEAKEDGKKYEGPKTPAELLARLRERARKRHSQHVANVHARYTSAIGLASRRGTKRVRYAPSDQLLKSLVLAVVPKRMEFQQFLSVLWERYGFVIGHHQATAYINAGSSDHRAFQENAQRLEMRLASLGLLRRLSDACAYVENPMGVER